MLKIFDNNEFSNIINKDVSYLSFYEKYAESFDLNILYIVYLNSKKEATVAFIIFEKDNSILHIAHYNYSFLWIKNNLKSKGSRLDFAEAVYLLKEKYDNIVLRLTNIEDLRAFSSNGFKIEIRYTFVKKTGDLNYSYGIQKHYKRGRDLLKLKFDAEVDFEEIFRYQMSFLNKKRISVDKKVIYRYLNGLWNENKLIAFTVIGGNQLIYASGVVSLNYMEDVAYFLFCNTKDDKNKSAINAFMYIEIQKRLFDLGINNFDYMGANIKSIAEFKHTLNPYLMPVYSIVCARKIIDLIAIARSVNFFLKRLLAI
ncbi:MAG TPA: hypothetical protein VL125_16660 [Pelobium sp.]|nr:hypothetical protein [Pelobium sp.]